jgi:GAF domain-containing protein
MTKKTIPSAQDVARTVKDPKRLAVVRASEMLDTAYEEAFDELTREASRLLGTPVALLTLVDEYRDFVKSHVGLPEPYASAHEITDSPSFCQLTVAQAEPLAINDTRDVAMLRLFPSVQRLGVRAHLGVPLTVDGQAIGNCCVMDFRPRTWTPEDIATLTRLAQEATTRLSKAKARPKPSATH